MPVCLSVPVNILLSHNLWSFCDRTKIDLEVAMKIIFRGGPLNQKTSACLYSALTAKPLNLFRPIVICFVSKYVHEKVFWTILKINTQRKYSKFL